MGCKEIKAPEVPELDVSKLKGNIADQLPEGMSVDNLKQQAANPSFTSKLGASVGLTSKNLRAKFSMESIKTATGISFDNPLQAVGDAIGNAIGGLVDGITGAVTGAIDSIKSIGSQIKNFKPGSLSLNSPEGMFGSIKNKNLQQRIQEFEANRASRLANKCGEEFAKETTKVNKKIKDKTQAKAAAITPKEKLEIQKDPVKAEQKQEQIKEEVKQELKQEAEQEAVTKPKEERVIQDEVQAEKVKEIKLNVLSDRFFNSPTEAELSAGGIRMFQTDKGEDWPFIYMGDPDDVSEFQIRETLTLKKELMKERNAWKVTITDNLTYKNDEFYLVWIKPLDGDFISAYDQTFSARSAFLANLHSSTRAEYERARTIQWFRWFGNGGETIRKPDGTVSYIEDENFTARDAANYNAILLRAQDYGNIDWVANPLHYLENSNLSVPTFKDLGLYPGKTRYGGRDKVFASRVLTEDVLDCRRENYQKYGIYTDDTKTTLFNYRDLTDPCATEEIYNRTTETVKVTVPINEPIDNNSRFLAFTEAFSTAMARQQEIIETDQRDDSNDQLMFPNPRTGGMSPLPYMFMDAEQKRVHMHVTIQVNCVRNHKIFEGGREGYQSGEDSTKEITKKIYVLAQWSATSEQYIVTPFEQRETAETWSEGGRKASVNGLKLANTKATELASQIFA